MKTILCNWRVFSTYTLLHTHYSELVLAHSLTHTHTHTHTRTQHARTHTRTHAHTHTHARTHTRTHIRTHARTHARTRTHTHTHTHTHTQTDTAPWFIVKATDLYTKGSRGGGGGGYTYRKVLTIDIINNSRHQQPQNLSRT